jgi:hypothetical protein
MIIVREHIHIGPHVVHNHREPLKQGIDGLTGEMSEVFVLSPVRPVLAWTVGKNIARGKNSKLPRIDLPIRSTDQSDTLGIVGVPRGLPLARSSVPKTHSIKRNQKSTLKNTSNPRTPKTPKSSPLNHGFWRGIKGKRTTKGSHEFPP